MSKLDYKAMANRLAEHLAVTHGFKLRHTSSMAAIAAAFGARDWHTLMARAEPAPAAFARLPGLKLGVTPEDNREVLLEDGDASPLLLLGPDAVRDNLRYQLASQQLTRGKGLIYFGQAEDPALESLAQLMAVQGRAGDFHLLDFEEPNNSDSYNPCYQREQFGPSRIAAMFPNINSPGGDYYREQAEYLLRVIFDALEACEFTPTLSAISDLVTTPQLLETLKEKTKMSSSPRADEADYQLGVLLDGFMRQTRNGPTIDQNKFREQFGALAGRLRVLASESLPDALCHTAKPTVVPERILEGGQCLYVRLPAHQDNPLGLLVSMALKHVMDCVVRLTTAQDALVFLPPMADSGRYLTEPVIRHARTKGIRLVAAESMLHRSPENEGRLKTFLASSNILLTRKPGQAERALMLEAFEVGSVVRSGLQAILESRAEANCSAFLQDQYVPCDLVQVELAPSGPQRPRRVPQKAKQDDYCVAEWLHAQMKPV
jgi:hypothetical protein